MNTTVAHAGSGRRFRRLSVALAALILAPATMAATATSAFAATAMYSAPAYVECDNTLHQMTVHVTASGINPTASTPQTIWVRFWIYNYSRGTYPLKFYTDGSTAYRSFQYTPVTETRLQDWPFTSTVTFSDSAKVGWTFNLPAGKYGVWTQYAWMTSTGQVNSPVWQTTQFRPDGYGWYTSNTLTCYV